MRELDGSAPVVVGVDGSARDHDALDWAVSEASATRRPLRIVHALDAPWNQPTVLAEAVVRAQEAAPDLEVISVAVVEGAVPALLREAEAAELLVVGNRGHGGRAGWLTGSVSHAVAARASCPVIVVRPRDADALHGDPGAATASVVDAATDRVVVASDGSELAAAATRFAFRFAAARRLRLTVVRAWTPPFAGYPRLVLGVHQLVRAERHELLADLSVDRHEFPEVEVELTLVRDKRNHHGRALVEESANAALVVLGSHGHSGLAERLADAVCQSVLEHARCPVAVVKLQPATEPMPVQRTPQLSTTRADATRRPRDRMPGSTAGEVTAVLRWLQSN